MAPKQSNGPYFRTINAPIRPPPFPPTLTSTFRPRRSLQYSSTSNEMVDYKKLGNDALIAKAVAPDTSKPKMLPKPFTSYTPEVPEYSDRLSRKKRTHSGRHRNFEDDKNEMTESDASETARYTRKSKRHLIEPDNNRPVSSTKRKYPASSFLASSSSSEDYGGRYTQSSISKSLSRSSKHLKHKRKPPAPPKNKKAIGTPVPYSLENAHEADKQLWMMKAEGKPWKDIKKVWEELMGKKTGDSTLSVRYCKMKENFEKCGGKDDIRLLKLKKEVEAEFEKGKWALIAAKSETDGLTVMTATEARNRYTTIERNGFPNDGHESEGEGGFQDAPGIDGMTALDRELAGITDEDVEGTEDLDAELEDSDYEDGMGAEARADGESGGLTLAEIEALAKYDGGQEGERTLESRGTSGAGMKGEDEDM